MLSLELSKNDSFYQLACHTTDAFTSCIRIYESLLPYFEAERPADNVNRKLFNIDGILTTLYNELTTLKNEITTAAVVFDDGDKVSKPSVESKGLIQTASEHSQQENIISEESTVEQKISNKKEEINELPKRSWEVVREVPAEEYQGGEVNHENSEIEKTISQGEKVCIKPTENITKQPSDFGYICENCNENITVYNQDLELSIALHDQDGCCRGKPRKLIAVQKERPEKKVNMVSGQGQVQNVTKYQETTDRLNLPAAQLDTVYNVRYSHFRCIQSLGNGFICTICNKMIAGPKNFHEHVRGNYHQTCLRESSKQIQKNTSHKKSVTNVQLVQKCENKSPAPAKQKESDPSLNVQLASIIKRLSGSLYSQMQYLSVVEGAIMCNLCGCPIPPTVTNVKDHLLGSRHSNNQTDLESQNYY